VAVAAIQSAGHDPAAANAAILTNTAVGWSALANYFGRVARRARREKGPIPPHPSLGAFRCTLTQPECGSTWCGSASPEPTNVAEPLGQRDVHQGIAVNVPDLPAAEFELDSAELMRCARDPLPIVQFRPNSFTCSCDRRSSPPEGPVSPPG